MTQTNQARPADGADLTHLGGRQARSSDAPDDGRVLDPWSGRRVPEHYPRLLDATAHEYVRRVRETGTAGTAAAYLNGLRQEAPEWLNPWGFVEAVTRRLTGEDA